MRKENNPAAYPSDNKIILLIVFARFFFSETKEWRTPH